MSENLVARLGEIIEATVRMAYDLKGEYGFDPAPGSQGDHEREAGIAAGGHRLALEANQMAETRLVATAGTRRQSVVSLDILNRLPFRSSQSAHWLAPPSSPLHVLPGFWIQASMARPADSAGWRS